MPLPAVLPRRVTRSPARSPPGGRASCSILSPPQPSPTAKDRSASRPANQSHLPQTHAPPCRAAIDQRSAEEISPPPPVDEPEIACDRSAERSFVSNLYSDHNMNKTGLFQKRRGCPRGNVVHHPGGRRLPWALRPAAGW